MGCGRHRGSSIKSVQSARVSPLGFPYSKRASQHAVFSPFQGCVLGGVQQTHTCTHTRTSCGLCHVG